MLTAITRKVSSSLVNCELSFIERKPIELEKARAQHHAYEALLEKLGAKVISLPEERELPDSMFVEDPRLFWMRWLSFAHWARRPGGGRLLHLRLRSNRFANWLT